MNKIVIMILAMFAMIGTASASNWYVTGQVNQTGTDASAFGGSTSLDTTNGFGIGGGYTFYGDWLSAEATYEDFGTGTSYGINHDANSVAAWIVASPTITTISSMPLKVIGRLGYASTEISGAGFTVRDDGVAYGAGLSLGVTNDIDVVLEHRRREIDGNIGGFVPVNFEFATTSLGIKYSF